MENDKIRGPNVACRPLGRKVNLLETLADPEAFEPLISCRLCMSDTEQVLILQALSWLLMADFAPCSH